MEPRIFHGNLTPDTLARALVGQFNRGNLRAQQLGSGRQVVVQISTPAGQHVGGDTALSVTIQQVTDGVSIVLGNQAWLGVAASLGKAAFKFWINPWSLVTQLDDLAQDVENLQLADEVWKTIESTARAAGASYEISERLRRTVCAYCGTGNSLDASSCVACGAPLGQEQPHTCRKCGFVVRSSESACPNCHQAL